MQYLILFLVLLASSVGAWAAFTDRVRQSAAYLPLAIGVGTCTALLFGLGVRLLDEKQKIFLFSVYYDVVVAVAYYALPVLVFGCKPSPALLAGSLVILAGLMIVHLGD